MIGFCGWLCCLVWISLLLRVCKDGSCLIVVVFGFSLLCWLSGLICCLINWLVCWFLLNGRLWMGRVYDVCFMVMWWLWNVLVIMVGLCVCGLLLNCGLCCCISVLIVIILWMWVWLRLVSRFLCIMCVVWLCWYGVGCLLIWWNMWIVVWLYRLVNWILCFLNDCGWKRVFFIGLNIRVMCIWLIWVNICLCWLIWISVLFWLNLKLLVFIRWVMVICVVVFGNLWMCVVGVLVVLYV